MTKRLEKTFNALVLGFTLLLATTLLAFPSYTALASDEKTIIALETKAWEAWKSGDKAAYSTLMAEPAIKVSAAGIVSGKESFLAAELPTGCSSRDFALDSFTTHKITDDVHAVTYAAQITQTCNDEPDDHTLFVSSIWAKKGDTWKNVMLTEVDIAN